MLTACVLLIALPAQATGVLLLDDESIGASQSVADAARREAESLAGVVLVRQAPRNAACSAETWLQLDASLCNASFGVALRNVIVIERVASDQGVVVRMVFAEGNPLVQTRAAEVLAPFGAEHAPSVLALFARLFADYGELRILSWASGLELFVDERMIGALSGERIVRLPPGQHALAVRRFADRFELSPVAVRSRETVTRSVALPSSVVARR